MVLVTSPDSDEDTPQAADPGATDDLVPRKHLKMQSALRRLHVDLGRCSQAGQIRMVHPANTKPQALELARRFKCSICEANRQPKGARLVAPSEGRGAMAGGVCGRESSTKLGT